MKRVFLAFTCALLGFLTGCATAPTAPTDDQVRAINTYCAIDAGVRPSIQALQIFATPAENAAIETARSIIDPICSNPTAPVQTNAISALTGAVLKLTSIELALKNRQLAH